MEPPCACAGIHMRGHAHLGPMGLPPCSGTRAHQVHVPDMHPRALNHTEGKVEDLGICPPQWPSGKSSGRRAQPLSPGVVRSWRRGLSSSLCTAQRDTVECQ